jgi:hypothetical protein
LNNCQILPVDCTLVSVGNQLYLKAVNSNLNSTNGSVLSAVARTRLRLL